jgi:predicted RNA-binding Zn-ribbon protein involved in translation (DUF1610 family)
MRDTQPNRRASRTAELIVIWASSDDTRCVLAILDGVLELRLEHDGTVVRRAHYIDIRPARDAAQEWRIDWDIERRSHEQSRVETICPECGDEALREVDAEGGMSWFRCPSCGDAWTLDAARERQGDEQR